MIDVLLAQVAQLKKDKETLMAENKELRQEVIDSAITIKQLSNTNKVLSAEQEVELDNKIQSYLLSKQ